MELREAFDIADLDKGGALELDEVSIKAPCIDSFLS
jgi:hypothetical protein